MTRDEWIKEACRELNQQALDQHIALTMKVHENNMDWAEALAETYYDEDPDEYTPKQAIMEDLSNA